MMYERYFRELEEVARKVGEQMAFAIQNTEEKFTAFFRAVERDLMIENSSGKQSRQQNNGGHHNPFGQKTFKGYQRENKRKGNRWAKR